MVPKVGPSLIVTSGPCLLTRVLSWLTTASLRTWSAGISWGNRCACTRMPTPLPSDWNRTVEPVMVWAFDVHLVGMVIVHPKAGSPTVFVLLPTKGTWTAPVAARTPMASATTTRTARRISLMLRRLGSGSGTPADSQGGPPSVALIDNLCLCGQRIAVHLRPLLLEDEVERSGAAGRDRARVGHVVGGPHHVAALVVEGAHDVGEVDGRRTRVRHRAGDLVVRPEGLGGLGDDLHRGVLHLHRRVRFDGGADLADVVGPPGVGDGEGGLGPGGQDLEEGEPELVTDRLAGPVGQRDGDLHPVDRRPRCVADLADHPRSDR